MKVLNFGSLNLDYVYQVDHFVQPGETMSVLSQSINPGGKGLNQSIALARAGAKVYHAGCTGIGGESLLDLLRENDVDTSFLVSVKELQGNAVIQVSSTGENCILLFGGSNQCIEESQVRETIAAFSQGDWLILQNEINCLPLIVDKAYEKGMRIVLNPSPFNEKLDAVDFSKLNWLFVNEVEAEQITGSKDPKTAWEILHDRYPSLSVLITLGSIGSMAFRLNEGEVEAVKQDAYKVKAVDTTAAGDTFTGYFIASILQGRTLSECMKIASIASAIAVTRPGAAPSIPKKEEVESALESML